MQTLIQAADSQPRYHYQPLDETKRQIRLFRLAPNVDPAAELHGSLQVFDKASAPQYKALSYMWGPALALQSILVDGQVIKIRQNLYDFFLVFRLAFVSEGGWIWADQICIDQSSTWERNHQVQMMAEIFTQAFSVIIWLGSNGPFNPSAGMYHMSEFHYLSLLKEERHKFRTLEYWNRTWIIQEIFLAKRREVIFGQMTIDWDIIRDHATEIIPSGWGIWLTMEEGSWKYIMPAEAVRACSLSDCEDPRDKYYTLHGLLNPAHRLIVDYSKPVSEVCLDIIVMLLKTSNSEEYGSVGYVVARLVRHMRLFQSPDDHQLQAGSSESRFEKKVEERLSKFGQMYMIDHLGYTPGFGLERHWRTNTAMALEKAQSSVWAPFPLLRYEASPWRRYLEEEKEEKRIVPSKHPTMGFAHYGPILRRLA